MNRSVKGLIGLGAAVAVLGGGLAVLKYTEPKDQPDEASTSVQETTQPTQGSGLTPGHDEKAADLEGVIIDVVVTNADEKIHVIKDDEASDESVTRYTLDGFEGIPLNSSVIGTLANNARNMTTTAIIEENCTDLEKFGLENPSVTVEVKYASGNKKKFFIGDRVPSGADMYVMFDGSNTVYTVPSSYLANYTKTTMDFIETTILPEPAEDAYPIIESLRIERQDLDYDIFLEYDKKNSENAFSGGTSATHVMVEPTDAYLTVERSSDITNGMFGLNAKGIYSVNCKESDIAGAGLNEPFCTVTMVCDDGNTYVLRLSEPFTNDDGEKCYYAMLNDVDIIYIVAASDARWGEITPIDITSRIMIGSYVWNITDLSIKTADKAEKFVIKRKPEAEGKEKVSTTDFTVTRNGEEFDAERYRQFYSFLISAAAEEFAIDTEIPDDDPMVTLEYTDSYSGQKMKFEFYDYSTLRSLITINGKSKYFCTKSYVDTLIDNISRISTGEEYVTTWK